MTRVQFLASLVTVLFQDKSVGLQRLSEETVPQLSLMQLIANPEKYDERSVLVAGFLRLEVEGNVLYLHEEDSKHHLFKNGIWIMRNDLLMAKRDSLNNRYATLVGTFSAKNKGHRSVTSGSLRDITYARIVE